MPPTSGSGLDQGWLSTGHTHCAHAAVLTVYLTRLWKKLLPTVTEHSRIQWSNSVSLSQEPRQGAWRRMGELQRPLQLPDCPVYFLTANSHHLVLERPVSYFPFPPFISRKLRKCKSWRHSEGMHDGNRGQEKHMAEKKAGKQTVYLPTQDAIAFLHCHKWSGLSRIETCDLRASLFYYAYQLHLSLARKYH